MGNATNVLRGPNNNGYDNKGRMGNTVKSGEQVEAVKTGNNVNHSKEGIEEIINGNIERDSVKNNYVTEPIEQVTTENPEKILNKTNMNEKMKTVIGKERKYKENVLRKYCQLNVQGLITTNQPQEKVELLRDLMNKERPLYLALTETWLHEHKDAEVHIEDYTIYRKDKPLRRDIGRRGRHVGGVALYIDSSWLPDSK